MSTIEIGVNLTLQQDTTSGNLYYTLNDIQTNLEWPVTIINTTPTAYITIFFEPLILTNTNQYCIIDSDYITLDGQNNDFTINNVFGWLGFIQSGKFVDGVIFSAKGNIKIQNFVTKTLGITTLDTDAGYLCQSYIGVAALGNYTINNCINYGDINNLSTEQIGCGGIFGSYAFSNSVDNIFTIFTVTNCVNYGAINTGLAGGIFGRNAFDFISNCTIDVSDCVNHGPISADETGGIFGSFAIGLKYSNNSGVRNCTNHGVISGLESGGIFSSGLSNIGNPTETAIFFIENCVNFGNITNSQCGGIMSKATLSIVTKENVIFKDCVNHGNIISNSGGIAYSVSCSARFQNCYSDGTNLGGGILNNQFVSNQITIDNCYTLEGTLYSNASNTITSTNCYIADGSWNSLSAMTDHLDYTNDTVWVYDKESDITNTSIPFVLRSFNPNNDIVGVVLSPVLSIQAINDKQIGDADFDLVPLLNLQSIIDPNAVIIFIDFNSIITITVKTVHINSVGITPITARSTSNNTFYSISDSIPVSLRINLIETIIALNGGEPNNVAINQEIDLTNYLNSNRPNDPYVYDFNTALVSVVSPNKITLLTNAPATIMITQAASGNYTESNIITYILSPLSENTLAYPIPPSQNANGTYNIVPTIDSKNNTNDITYTFTLGEVSIEPETSSGNTTITFLKSGTIKIYATQLVSDTVKDISYEIDFTVLSVNTLTLADIIAVIGKNYPVTPIGGNGTSIKYNIDDTTIATVSPTDSSNGQAIITPIAIGSTTMSVTQAASVDMSNIFFIVNINVVAENTITFENPPTSVYVGSTTTLSIITPSMGTIEYSTSILGTVSFNLQTTNSVNMHAEKADTTIISVNQSENDQYGPGENSFSLIILLNYANLVFDSPKTSALIGETFEVNASSDNKETINYSSSNTNIATVMGKMVTIVGLGTTSIIARQTKTETYEEAETSYVLTTSNGKLLYDITSGDAIVIGSDYSIKNVIIPSEYNGLNVVGIAPDAFYNKPETLSGTIEFPPTLTFIGASAFKGSALSGYLTLPASIISIGSSAFLGCGFEGTLTLPPLLEVLENGVFDRCSFTSLAPPTNLRLIGAYAFFDNPMFVYDFTQCEQLAYIDPTAFNMTGLYDFLDVNVYVTGFTYDRIKKFPFPIYVKLHTGIPVSNICFLAGTIVQTDQGNLPIETLTRKNTLRGQPITLTKTMHNDPYLVKIQAYAFTDTPTKDIYMSMNHRVYFNHDRIKARDLVNGETIIPVDYHGQPLYNVLVKSHTSMRVHGLRVETLDPTSAIALVYTSRLPPIQRVKIIQKLNTQENYEETVTYLKRNQ